MSCTLVMLSSSYPDLWLKCRIDIFTRTTTLPLPSLDTLSFMIRIWSNYTVSLHSSNPRIWSFCDTIGSLCAPYVKSARTDFA